MNPLLALVIGSGLLYLGFVGTVIFYVARDKLRARRAVQRRLAQSASSHATAANATAKPAAKITTRIISERPFVLLRTP